MGFRLSREFYIPKGGRKVADKLSDAVAYLYANANGAPCATMFYGKQAKPLWRFRFRNEAEMERRVREGFEGRRAHARALEKDRAERKAYVNHYKVGDIMRTHWGYEQTNIEYFEVVEVKGKHVIVREIAKDGYSTGWAMEQVGPMPGNYVGKPKRRLAQKTHIKIDNIRTAFPAHFKEVAWIKVYETSGATHYA